MRFRTILLGCVVTLGWIWAQAQSSSASQSANTPEPQTVQQNSGATANPQDSSAAGQPISGDATNSAVLQSRIQEALRNEPTLGSSKASVNVTDNSIDLSGTVGSSKDKQTAERIAESFDGNRQLNDKLLVTGHGHSDMAPEHPAINNGGTGNAPNPAVNSGTSNPNPGR